MESLFCILADRNKGFPVLRALIENPELLILDDALSAVDAKTEEAILHNLKEIKRKENNYHFSSPFK